MDVLRILILLAVIFLEEGELAAAMVIVGSFLQIDEASTSIKLSPPLLLPPPPLHGCCEGHMVLLSFHPSHGGSLVCNSGIDIGDLDPNDELHVSAPPVWVLLLAEMEVFARPLFRISNHQWSTASAGRRAVRSRRQRLGSCQPGSGFGHLFTGTACPVKTVAGGKSWRKLRVRVAFCSGNRCSLQWWGPADALWGPPPVRCSPLTHAGRHAEALCGQRRSFQMLIRICASNEGFFKVAHCVVHAEQIYVLHCSAFLFFCRHGSGIAAFGVWVDCQHAML